MGAPMLSKKKTTKVVEKRSIVGQDELLMVVGVCWGGGGWVFWRENEKGVGYPRGTESVLLRMCFRSSYCKSSAGRCITRGGEGR